MSLLRDIQEMATDPKVRVTTLLLKARILAARLGHDAFDRWITMELDGYTDEAEAPAYRQGFERVIRGNFMNIAWKFSKIQIPSSALPEEAQSVFAPFAARMPISEVEELAASDEVAIPTSLPAGLNQLVTLYDNLDCTSIWAELPRQKFRAILDAVRAKVVEYALAIEKANPQAGEATPGDRPVPAEQLARIQQIFLGGSHVVTTAGRDATQTTIEVRVGNLDDLIREVERLGIGASERTELRAAIRDDGARPKKAKGLGPAVQRWIGQMTAKAATGTWQVGSQIGAQVLATLLMKFYGFM